MSYQKWTPPKAAPAVRFSGLKIVVTKGRVGLVKRAYISRDIAEKFRLAEYKAFDIYIDRERSLIGIDPIKSGAIAVNGGMRCSVTVLLQAVESFDVIFQRPISLVVPLIDVRKTKPPVQLELRVDDVIAALKEVQN